MLSTLKSRMSLFHAKGDRKFYQTRSTIRIFLLTLIIISLIIPTITSANTSKWLKPASYAEYQFQSCGISYNNTTIFFDANYTSTFHWDCIETNGSLAKFSVVLEIATANDSLRFSSLCFINPNNRTVYFTNGTAIGETYLWNQPNPDEKELLTLWAENSATNSSRISAYPRFGSFASSPQGWQEVYALDGSGRVRGINNQITGYYDRDTGVMLDCYLSSEPTLTAMGVTDIFRNGRQFFTETNIDLGPSSLLPDFLRYLPFIAISGFIIAGFGLFFAIYRIRRRHRKRKR